MAGNILLPLYGKGRNNRGIWNMIDSITDIEGLSSKILGEYDADPEEVKSDIVSFIRDLQWKKLIRLKEVLS